MTAPSSHRADIALARLRAAVVGTPADSALAELDALLSIESTALLPEDWRNARYVPATCCGRPLTIWAPGTRLREDVGNAVLDREPHTAVVVRDTGHHSITVQWTDGQWHTFSEQTISRHRMVVDRRGPDSGEPRWIPINDHPGDQLWDGIPGDGGRSYWGEIGPEGARSWSWTIISTPCVEVDGGVVATELDAKREVERWRP